MDKYLLWAENMLPIVIKAIVVLLAGWLLTKIAIKITAKGVNKGKIDPTASKFIKSAIKIIIYVFTLLIVLSILGIPVNSLIAAIGACGLALGLALQDTLSNVAGGLVILFTKPFQKGDFVEIDSLQGNVDSISIFHTVLITIDKKAVFLPNANVTKSDIINYTAETTRCLVLHFMIDYDEDFRKAISIIKDVISNSEFALADPEPIVRVDEHADSAIKIVTKVFVNSENYWDLNYELLENVKLAFDEEKISIPFNRLDVNLVK